MKAFWVGLVFLSLMWVFILPIYESPHKIWVSLLFLGVAANSIAFGQMKVQPISPSMVLLWGPLGLFVFVLPWPYTLGAILFMLALVSSLMAGENRKIQAVVSGLGFTGLVLLLQAIIWPVYVHVAARWHTVPILNPVLSFILHLLGAPVSFDEDGFFIQTAEGVKELFTTWESLGTYVFLNVVLGSTGLLLFSRRILESLGRLLLVLTGYAIARYVFLLLAFASFETTDIFWRRPWLILSFLPLPVILMKFVPLTRTRSVEVPTFWLNWRTATFGILMGMAALVLSGVFLFQDPGVKKQGRVLFDEGHSDWEWMDRPFDTEWYGERSSYNYYCLGQFLKHYYVVDIRKDPLSAELLKNYDVLVLKTPTTPYTPEEVEAVVQFVKAGGGLLLIGDHTNVFGMSTYLNRIARHFGFRFKYDATYDLATGSLSFYEPPRRGRHPVLGYLPFHMFATSCSLQAPLLSESVIVGYGLKALKADYSQRSFFPKEAHSASAMEFGLFLQTAASKQGLGRVLFYTDSTCFSNFYMFMPGKPELVLGAIEWLNRRNKYHTLNLWFLLLSLTTPVMASYLARRLPREQLLLWGLSGVLIGGAIGIATFDALNRRTYRPPEPRTPYPRLIFEAEHSTYYLPVKHLQGKHNTDMHTFYVWTQRLGLIPEVSYSFKKALESGDVLVLINPIKSFTPEEVEAFINYVERGGKVLLLDDPRNHTSSTSYQLLNPFDLRISFYEIPKGTLVNAAGEVIWQGEHFGEVQGGEPLLFVQPLEKRSQAKSRRESAPPKRPVLALAGRGRGLLAVLGCSYMFTGQVMGSTSTVPDERLRKIYELEYWIFRNILKLGQKAVRSVHTPLNTLSEGRSCPIAEGALVLRPIANRSGTLARESARRI